MIYNPDMESAEDRMKKESPAVNRDSDKVALYGLCIALMLVLGLLDRAVPLSALLSGAVPGLKLGLANTVLLYAVYLMNWKAAVLLMLAKVLLSGFLFGSVSAILYSLSGGVLSLAVMLPAPKNPKAGAAAVCILSFLSVGWLLYRNPSPRGQMLVCDVLIALAGLAALGFAFLLRRRPDFGVVGVSLAGAVAHNVGQVLMASRVLNTPALLVTYLPVLVGLGAVVGCVTGVVARQVFRILNHFRKGAAVPHE